MEEWWALGKRHSVHDDWLFLPFVSLAKPHPSAQARGSGRKPISSFVPAARNSAVQSDCRTAN